MLLHVLDPLYCLSLRVYHERPAIALGDYHSVLCGECV